MLIISLMLLVLIGFFALFAALIKFADGVIRVPSPVETGRTGSRPYR